MNERARALRDAAGLAERMGAEGGTSHEVATELVRMADEAEYGWTGAALPVVLSTAFPEISER
jgi:hypothetical protein